MAVIEKIKKRIGVSKSISLLKIPALFKGKDISKLNYGIIHSQVGFTDGVSIVMNQVEDVMVEEMKIPRSNLFYLVGKSKVYNPRIRQKRVIWHKHKDNLVVDKRFSYGLGGELNEKVENAISLAKEEIKKFVTDKKIDIIIAHNTSHPVNFVLAIALSRYCRDELINKRSPPKYILWWHDSHLERERYSKPANDIREYLLEGVPGRFVEYIIFINSLQFEGAQKYINEIDKFSPGYFKHLLDNHSVVYNTATRVVNNIEELESKYNERAERFITDFKIRELINDSNISLDDVQFVLQHTRIVERKRIDFALEYSYALFSELEKMKLKKAMIFLISGYHGDESGNYKRKLIRLNKKLSEKYKTKKFFLIFAEDRKESEIIFEEFPILIRKLKGISTYFSEVEGFGNNLLEVLAAGLVPAVYTYPVFKKDLAKFNFKTVALENFEITEDSIREMIKVIESDRIKTMWANKNINILRRKFSHETMAPKLKRAILRKRI